MRPPLVIIVHHWLKVFSGECWSKHERAHKKQIRPSFSGSSKDWFIRGYEHFKVCRVEPGWQVSPPSDALIRRWTRAQSLDSRRQVQIALKIGHERMERSYNEHPTKPNRAVMPMNMFTFLEKNPLRYWERVLVLSNLHAHHFTRWSKQGSSQHHSTRRKNFGCNYQSKNPGFALPTNEQLLAMIEAASKWK